MHIHFVVDFFFFFFFFFFGGGGGGQPPTPLKEIIDPPLLDNVVNNYMYGKTEVHAYSNYIHVYDKM